MSLIGVTLQPVTPFDTIIYLMHSSRSPDPLEPQLFPDTQGFKQATSTTMATTPDDKLFRISEDRLTKLCLYYTFGPKSLNKLASLFYEKYGEKLSAKQFKDAYEYMHDVEHPSFREARDMSRTKREQCTYLQQRLKLTVSKMQLTLRLQWWIS